MCARYRSIYMMRERSTVYVGSLGTERGRDVKLELFTVHATLRSNIVASVICIPTAISSVSAVSTVVLRFFLMF
jgi:hypothetical protein